jgi:hypothetical protein
MLNTDTFPIVYNLKGYANYHTTKMDPIFVNSVDVGENLVAYGKIIMNHQGINKTNFLHFNKGVHLLEPPVMFLSFHIDKIDQKKI